MINPGNCYCMWHDSHSGHSSEIRFPEARSAIQLEAGPDDPRKSSVDPRTASGAPMIAIGPPSGSGSGVFDPGLKLWGHYPGPVHQRGRHRELRAESMSPPTTLSIIMRLADGYGPIIAFSPDLMRRKETPSFWAITIVVSTESTNKCIGRWAESGARVY